jgi:hypothetical protein
VINAGSEIDSFIQPITDSDSHFLAWTEYGRSVALRVDSLGDPHIVRVNVDTLETETIAIPGFTYDLAAQPFTYQFSFTFSRGLGQGSELWLANFLALRAGWQKDRHTDEGATYAFGAGFERKLGGLTFRLDYAYTIPPSLPDMSSFSGSFVFDLFAPLVKIEKVEIAPVYASLYKHYSENPIGTATINYKGKEQLNYKINVAIPRLAQNGFYRIGSGRG